MLGGAKPSILGKSGGQKGRRPRPKGSRAGAGFLGMGGAAGERCKLLSVVRAEFLSLKVFLAFWRRLMASPKTC